MTRTVMLNKEDHRDLRIKTHYGAELGDGVMWAQTFAAEFRSVQNYYPILFQKDSQTGKFMSVALLGLEQGENLFIENGQWQAGYIPLMIQRIPFSIGVAKADDGHETRHLINVDIEHPRVSREQGQRLFEDHGAATPFLEKISGMLETIHVWHQDNEVFIKTLEELELLEQVSIDITLEDGTKGQLLGFYTINEKNLRQLADEQLIDLHRRHYLEAIYMAVASIARVRSLMERKLARKTAG